MLVISAIALVVQHQAAADDPPKTSRYYRQRAAEAYKAKDYSTAIENLKKAASGWILQAQPANEGGWNASLNPTHGSGWIVQVQPTKGRIGFLCCSSPSSLRREVREITNSSGARAALRVGWT